MHECIAHREDIMIYLQSKGMPDEEAFKVMEFIRKGLAANKLYRWEDRRKEIFDLMKEYDVPDWYIDSCKNIRYLFPKSHAIGFALYGYKALYFKLYYPEQFYKNWFKCSAKFVDEKFISKGYDYALKKYNSLKKKLQKSGVTDDEVEFLQEIIVVLEMYARGISY